MELTRREVEALLGAWALDALEPGEAARVESMLADDQALRDRAERLRRVADALAEDAAVAPPSAARRRLLDAVRRAPMPSSATSDPIELFTNQVDALAALLDELDADQWRERAAPYAWTVHGLVAHLLVIERYMAGQLGHTQPHPDGAAAHLALGADEIARQVRRPPRQTVTAWSEAASATIGRLRAGEPGPDEPVELHGWPFRTSTLLVARAFEVWTHADDIRRAVGRDVVAPTSPDLHTMSRFSVTSLPLLLPLVDGGARFGGARVVLTGAGGGTYDLGDSDNGARDALVALDVVDYCRHAARRIDHSDLGVVVEGDRAVADRLLAAAQVFAV